MTALICLFAVILDYAFAEPCRAHPLVGFGYLANHVERRINTGNNCTPLVGRALGAFAVLTMVFPFVGLTILVVEFLETDWFLELLLLYLIIGNKSLIQHAERVNKALNSNDLRSTRLYVGYMVSRNTNNLQEGDVAKATVESVLENGNDAVFAAIFWYVLAGAPGAVLYRIANTLDAMWGYKTTQYRYFGWCAARLDDALNYIPARLTALTYALMGKFAQSIYCWKHQAYQWESPNAGPVMTAGAGALGVMLGGKAVYNGQEKNRPELGKGKETTSEDITRAILLLQRSVIFCLACIALFTMAGTIVRLYLL